MAVTIAKHTGARYVVITDINPYRLELARKMGATRVLNATTEKIEDVVKELGMKEGFGVGLEMSGSAQAFRSMLSNMCHGAKIAMLGIQESNAAIDWNLVIFNGLTIKGIYGREMYETWDKITSMIQTGLDISPIITHRFRVQLFEEGFEILRSGKFREGHS